MDHDHQNTHDLSPARFFRRSPAPRVPAAAADRRSRDDSGTGGWVHLRAWMRMQRPLLDTRRAVTS